MVEHFADNLRDISRAGTDAGASVALCTVGVNLKDNAPFASEHRSGLGEEDLSAWEEAYRAGANLEAEGNCVEAMEHYRRAARIDDLYAELHFRMGDCHLAMEERDKALKAFVRARDLDVLRFRADSRLNEAVREIANALENQGVFLVDAEKTLGEAARVPGLPGASLFYEHVHLTFEGNYALARSVFEQIHKRPPFSSGSIQKVPSIDECAEKLALTAWNRQSMLQSILNMVRDEPFKSRFRHEEDVVRLEKQMADLVRQETPERANEAKAQYEQAIERRDDDVLLRHSAARIFATLREYPTAERQYRAVL
jgi:tetratricopeptide (TPR) repeat protein